MLEHCEVALTILVRGSKLRMFNAISLVWPRSARELSSFRKLANTNKNHKVTAQKVQGGEKGKAQKMRSFPRLILQWIMSLP